MHSPRIFSDATRLKYSGSRRPPSVVGCQCRPASGRAGGHERPLRGRCQGLLRKEGDTYPPEPARPLRAFCGPLLAKAAAYRPAEHVGFLRFGSSAALLPSIHPGFRARGPFLRQRPVPAGHAGFPSCASLTGASPPPRIPASGDDSGRSPRARLRTSITTLRAGRRARSMPL